MKYGAGPEQISQTPESIAQLREEVWYWLERATKAIDSFHEASNPPHYFDNNQTDLDLQTTSGCYIALTHACRNRVKDASLDQWYENFLNFINGLADKDFEATGNYELARLASTRLVYQYIERYKSHVDPKKIESYKKNLDQFYENMLGGVIQKRLKSCVDAEKGGYWNQWPIDDIAEEQEQFSNCHYAINQELLRAAELYKLEPFPTDDNTRNKRLKPIYLFCLQQSYHFQRESTHRIDPFNLVFAIVIQALYHSAPDSNLCDAVLETIAGLQLPEGNWLTAYPLVPKKETRYIFFPSSEIALALTRLYFVPQISSQGRLLLLQILEKHFRNWVVPTYSERGGRSGWFHDMPIKEFAPRGLTTAAICQFLANYHLVLEHHLNRSVIESLSLQENSLHYLLDSTAPEDARQKIPDGDPWPDHPPRAWSDPKKPEDLQAAIQKQWTDPSLNKPVEKNISFMLSKKVIAPILDNPAVRPDRPYRHCGILSGPPGTRKTSLVKQIAENLGWPQITVPASVIFADGWDQLEARAQLVFRRLRYLSRCIIFLDEFEEFFRERKAGADKADTDKGSIPTSPVLIDNRTLAAFVTSAMLPRLQDLHDDARCIVLLATNHVKELDEAIRRSGRFDFQLLVDHPRLARAKEYARKPSERTCKSMPGWENNQRKISDAVLNALDDFNNTNIVPFSAVEDALRHAHESVKSGTTPSASVMRKFFHHKDKEGGSLDAPQLEDV